MISKRVLFIALALIAVSATSAMAATVNVDDFVVGTLSIGATDQLNLQSAASYGIVTVTPNSTISAYVNTGFNGGGWDGVGGINSSKAAEQATLGTVYTTLGDMNGQDALDLLGPTFYGHTVAPTDTLIRYTYYGDSDFDGVVTDLDYGFINYAYGVAGTPDAVSGFVWGDFDRDGVVTDLDYGYINYLYGEGGQPLGPLGTSFTAAAGAAATAVPEPSTLILLVVSSLCALFVTLRKR